jgi:phospholipase C
MVISPFAKKNFVSHTPMDYTAYLRFIETRWKLPTLTARDAAMPDMTEFFDFSNKPWATPPSLPAQNTSGVATSPSSRELTASSGPSSS